MKPNVRIVVRDRGKIVARREVHNTWTAHGKQYLAEVIALTDVSADTPERSAQIEYIGFGMGGVQQNQRAMVTGTPLSTVYPLGSTPHGTSGFTYRDDFIHELSSLELPVAVERTSATDAYANPVGKTWRQSAGSLATLYQLSSHPAPNIFRFHFSSTVVNMVYTPPLTGNEYHLLPLSEAGLFLSEESPSLSPFAPPVAYVTFDTIQVSETVEFYLEWDVTF